MSQEDDFWALATRLLDRVCVTCSDCGNRKLENQPCDHCSAPPRPGLLRAKPLQAELARRQKKGDLTWEQLARECGLSSRTILRIFAADWTLNVADRIVTALGMHGTEIWGSGRLRSTAGLQVPAFTARLWRHCDLLRHFILLRLTIGLNIPRGTPKFEVLWKTAL